ncbi:MAG: flagellar biosynthesis anti-sigma factor FlgM [Sulfurospirillaceae bacterium]|nr:flagellar biosynthesis anti-sigma factor FlgM [Sulfurospirillaceae bacterium]
MVSNISSGSPQLVQQTVSKSEEKKETIKTEDTKELDRVSALKKQIESGQYVVDTIKTANAIAEALI